MCYPILGIWGVLGGQDLHQSKAHPTTSQYVSIQNFALSAATWLEFQGQIMAHQLEPRLGGYGGPGGLKWYQSKCQPHITIQPLYMI